MKAIMVFLIMMLAISITLNVLAYDGITITPEGDVYMYTPGSVIGPNGMTLYTVPTDWDRTTPLYPPEMPLSSGPDPIERALNDMYFDN